MSHYRVRKSHCKTMRKSAAVLREYAKSLFESTTADGQWPADEEPSRREYLMLTKLSDSLDRMAARFAQTELAGLRPAQCREQEKP